jgi:hypothetical protein
MEGNDSMTEADNANLTITLKAGTGYDSPWIVVRGDNPQDVTAKLNGLGDVIAATVQAAELFKGAGNAAPLTVPEPQAPAQQPQQQSGWGQAPQQQAAPQQYQQAPPPRNSKFGGPPHPEGKTCNCGTVLEMKETGSGKKVFRCPQWRWNNGNPNGHDSEFVN